MKRIKGFRVAGIVALLVTIAVTTALTVMVNGTAGIIVLATYTIATRGQAFTWPLRWRGALLWFGALAVLATVLWTFGYHQTAVSPLLLLGYVVGSVVGLAVADWREESR